MVKIALKVSFLAENISRLSVCGPEFDWNLKLKCTQCNETDENWHSINENEQIEGKKGHSTCNFQMKCKFCSNFATLDVIKDSIKPIDIGESGSVKDVTLVAFDCRGVEPVDFDPLNGWIGKNDESNSVFNDIDFTEESNAWVGFDEKTNNPVSIDEFSSKFFSCFLFIMEGHHLEREVRKIIARMSHRSHRASGYRRGR
ncbi:UPF0587 protein GA18326 [Cimex lectularius]|uniref:Uncharacterized protein n=1 Tax=Cimex lectularius TaxID=79782 RepID=A0A8I6RB71_CIMLE|nr:UPF0587 protein GA18326 [Cimex lectularius]